MSCNLIQYQGGRKIARPVSSEEEYRRLRGTSAQYEYLVQARNGNHQAKMRLVQFNYSGHYPEGVVKGTKLPSGAFGFDIDDRSAFDKVVSLLLDEGRATEAAQRLGLLMLERSVNQGGHAVFRREPGRTILENQVRIATALRCEMDTNAHDINRVYFTTSDAADDLLYVSPALFADAYDEGTVRAEATRLEQREQYHRELLPEGAHKADKHYCPWCAAPAPVPQTAAPVPAAPVNALPAPPAAPAPGVETLTYLGIPYSRIIDKWWTLYNDGQPPCPGNRNTLTFELAVNLRHICGFDRALLNRVIPDYWSADSSPDGAAHEKMACIDSALSEKRTQMPRRLRDVLTELKKEILRSDPDGIAAKGGDDILSALEEVEQEDDLYYYNRIPQQALPQGIADSIQATGQKMVMPVMAVCCPAIGALATDVSVVIHGRPTKLNMHAFVVGEAASGKGMLDGVVDAWMAEETDKNTLYYQQEQDYRLKKKAAKNAKTQPEEPHLPVRYLTMNNTVANLAERLANTCGRHAFSFTPEADTVAQRWRTSLNDFSTMLRQSYDGSRYDREAKSAEATTVHIDHLLWNVCMCGTPDALYRVISNYTDGLLSRFIIAHMPDNTFAPLDAEPTLMTDKLRDRIGQIAHLLPMMQGMLHLERLEERACQWVEKVRREALKDDDQVMARARLRDHGTAMRMTACIILCAVAEQLIDKYGMTGAEKQLKMYPTLTADLAVGMQTPAMLDLYEVLAESLIDNDMLYFREKLENATLTTGVVSERNRSGKNDLIYDRLPDTFSFDQAMAVKGNGCTRNSIKQMLKNWRKQGLIVARGRGYAKV